MPKRSNSTIDTGRIDGGKAYGGARTEVGAMKRRGGSGGGGHGAAGGASSRRDGGGYDGDGHGRDGEGKLRIHLKRSCTDRKVVPEGGTELALTTDGEV